MTSNLSEARIIRTYSLLVDTERMINEISARTFRNKQNVIDLAVAKLHAEIVGTGSDEPAYPSDQPEPMITK
ncbi:MAG: hypothetical protein ACYC11_02550 [Bellilinea sp.]